MMREVPLSVEVSVVGLGRVLVDAKRLDAPEAAVDGFAAVGKVKNDESVLR